MHAPGHLVLVAMIFAGALCRHACAEWGPETIAVSVGLEEIFDTEGRRPLYAAEIGFTEWTAGLAPVVEVNVSAKGSVFGGLGLAWRWDAESLPLGFRVGVAPGYYEQGRDKFLGGSFQIYSFIETGWKLSATERIGLRLAHLSNASTADTNPGTEILGVVYERKLSR